MYSEHACSLVRSSWLVTHTPRSFGHCCKLQRGSRICRHIKKVRRLQVSNQRWIAICIQSNYRVHIYDHHAHDQISLGRVSDFVQVARFDRDCSIVLPVNELFFAAPLYLARARINCILDGTWWHIHRSVYIFWLLFHHSSALVRGFFHLGWFLKIFVCTEGEECNKNDCKYCLYRV